MTALKNLTWPQVEKLQRDVLIVALGSIEQHGPHLPLDTDSVIAQAIAQELHRTKTTSGLAPTVTYGASGEHRDFAGTLSIGTSALTMLLTELIRDATRYWRSVLFINGHGGNSEALTAALLLAKSESRHVAVVSMKGDSADTHAGYQETSLMLHLDPTRVLLERLEVGNTAPLHQLLPTMKESGVRAISTNGVLGDPTKASAELGSRLFNEAVDGAGATYDALLHSLL